MINLIIYILLIQWYCIDLKKTLYPSFKFLLSGGCASSVKKIIPINNMVTQTLIQVFGCDNYSVPCTIDIFIQYKWWRKQKSIQPYDYTYVKWYRHATKLIILIKSSFIICSQHCGTQYEYLLDSQILFYLCFEWRMDSFVHSFMTFYSKCPHFLLNCYKVWLQVNICLDNI